VALWLLIGLFGFMAAAHVVLTVLFYAGIHDTGVGYVFDWQWPAWLIAIIDGTVAWLPWFADRRCTDTGRAWTHPHGGCFDHGSRQAAWTAIVPVLLIIVVAKSVLSLVGSRAAPART